MVCLASGTMKLDEVKEKLSNKIREKDRPCV